MKIEDWIKNVGIKSYKQLETFCKSIGVEPPSKESCSSIFAEIIASKNEQLAVKEKKQELIITTMPFKAKEPIVQIDTISEVKTDVTTEIKSDESTVQDDQASEDYTDELCKKSSKKKKNSL